MNTPQTHEIYYDRQTRAWHGFWKDENGDQIADAVNAPSRDLCLIYLGMEKADWNHELEARLSAGDPQ